MKVFIYGDSSREIVAGCAELAARLGFALSVSHDCDLGIAPYQLSKIPSEELARFRLGVLVFHPSPLPMHGGKSAIKNIFKSGATYGGVTWFWADAKLDNGDICEQSVFKINTGESPSEFYKRVCVPEGLRLLSYALLDIKNGVIRKRPQIKKYGSYEV